MTLTLNLASTEDRGNKGEADTSMLSFYAAWLHQPVVVDAEDRGVLAKMIAFHWLECIINWLEGC